MKIILCLLCVCEISRKTNARSNHCLVVLQIRESHNLQRIAHYRRLCYNYIITSPLGGRKSDKKQHPHCRKHHKTS